MQLKGFKVVMHVLLHLQRVSIELISRTVKPKKNNIYLEPLT